MHRLCKNYNNKRHNQDHCRQFSQQQHQRRSPFFWSWTKYRRTQYFLLNAHLYLFFIRNFKTIVLESSINDNCSFYPAHFAEKFHHYPVGGYIRKNYVPCLSMMIKHVRGVKNVVYFSFFTSI